MATQQQVQNTLLAATLKVANMTNANLTILAGGGLSVNWKPINQIQRGINAVTRQYNLSDYSSSGFTIAYDCLLNFVGIDPAGTINPNAQNPNTIINSTSAGTTVNSNKYPFVNTTSIGLYTYNILYKHLYGNNPTVAFYLNNNTQDEATPNNIEYATPGDISSDIISITWDYPLPVSGYISITGAVDGNGNTPSGGVTELPFDQDNLISDAGNYYLELPVGIPISVISNNVSIPGFSYDKNYSPPRLYGFAGNYTQEIIVTVV